MYLLCFFIQFLFIHLIFADNIAFSKQLGYEGSVLLENKNRALPLDAGTKVAVFGMNQKNLVKSGKGSGEVKNVAYVRSLINGLQKKVGEKKIILFDELVQFYQNYQELREPEPEPYLLRDARKFANVAIITFGRYEGEEKDRKQGGGDYLLSPFELNLVDKVLALNFRKVILILNIGGVIDTSWFKSPAPTINIANTNLKPTRGPSKMDAVLLVWQPGMEGGDMIADLLVGDAYPSGKLVDTLVRRYEDYPSASTFAESKNYVNYEEDVFSGYRYFETIPGASGKVNYEFGYGLTYTTFAFENITGRVQKKERVEGSEVKVAAVAADVKDSIITIEVTVRNTGTRPGKEVVQVYYSAPQGVLGKPAKSLGGFQKTRELKKGEVETVQVAFAVGSMASYDDIGHVADAAWVLEKGDYRFFVGSSVRDVVEVGYVYHVEGNLVTEQLSHALVPRDLRRRLLANGTYETLPQQPPPQSPSSLQQQTPPLSSPPSPPSLSPPPTSPLRLAEPFLLQDVAQNVGLMPAFLAQLSIDELLHLAHGRKNTIPFASTGGIGWVRKFGIPNVHTADGPSGARLRSTANNTTAFPIATMVACTWNPPLAAQLGVRVADELIAHNIGIWLAPAVNLHRDPLCGRNFEYLSEDPLVAGKIAAAIVRGAQSRNVSATVKHFIANGKETNRRLSDSRMSERAARELYLRNFEIAVKEGNPWSLMTAYNLVNGVKAGESKDLLEKILRNEWGYEGLVMSDWDDNGSAVGEYLAGNDMKMPSSDEHSLREAIAQGTLTRTMLERGVERVLRMIIKTRVFADYDRGKEADEEKQRKLQKKMEKMEKKMKKMEKIEKKSKQSDL